MEIATGAMNTLIPKLAELVVGEYNLQKGVHGEIKELEKELESMRAALHKMAEVPADQLDGLAKIWTSDVRELSYDIEDTVDTFTLPAKGGQHTKLFSAKGLIGKATNLYNKAKINHQIHSVIQDIMGQVKVINERRGRYNVVDGMASRPNTVAVDPRLEAMYRKATELVGINKPKNELAKRLFEQDCSRKQQPYMISIVGFGGLGKTTLANSLLQDHKAQFDCHFFVSVSLNPDIKNIFKKILRQLDEKKCADEIDKWDEAGLIDKIRDLLEIRRFLCVIDDLWEESAWDSIKLAVKDGKSGSKIIITTRNKAVAERAGGVVYELKPLSYDDSRKLFSKRVFGYQDDVPSDLSEVTQKILKKCGGVPLAIITVASLLASKPMDSQEWEEVNKSITSELGDSLDVDKMRKILSLSYNDLPFHLKTCLLSLSIYPEDEVIRKDVVVWSWIAEGFISEETQPSGTTLREIGEGYFNELINRSLIQPVTDPYYEQDGEVPACQVHDMVLELINRLAGEEGYVMTLLSDDGQLTGTHTSAARKKKIRRLSLQISNKTYGSPKLRNTPSISMKSAQSRVGLFKNMAREELSSVRSLTVFGRVVLIPLLSSFRVIRVLQLEDCTGLDKNHFNGIGELRHLRFLRLWKYSATELPESIGKLESLETLDIRGGRLLMDVVLLPMSFIKLRKLVRLFTGRMELAQGLTLGDMESLQELEVCCTAEVIKEIGNLKELRTLRIIFNYYGTLDSVEASLMCLKKCTKLQDLEIGVIVGTSEAVEMQQVSSGLKRFVCNINIAAFPKWINSSTLSSLTTLSIRVVVYDKVLLPQHLEKLAQLPSLRFLRLYLTIASSKGRYQKLPIHSDASAFRCLRHFHFYSSSVLPMFQPGAMPQLERLCLQFFTVVNKNNSNDLGLENLRSLRDVTIYFSNDKLGEARANVREAIMNHSNHPSVNIF